MPYPIEKKLVVAVSSTVLFDLSLEHEIYTTQGLDAFRRYQRDHRHDIPAPGVGFPFIRRLLSLNRLAPDGDHPVDVVILSRYHADDGVRVMEAVKKYGLDICRAFFMAGRKPYPFMTAVNASLYLSTNARQVREAVALGYPAGHVLPCQAEDDPSDVQLRLGFDFDGILADDEAETIYKAHDLAAFQKHEQRNSDVPLGAGPLTPLLQRLAHLQDLDMARADADPAHKRLLRVSIVTARSAPAHERLVTTLSALGMEADEVFLLGGIEKKRVLDILKPHLFFDDQLAHLEPAAASTPCAHIPFGVANQPPPPAAP